MPVLAVDIGGTKIACGIVAEDGVLLHRESLPTDAHGDGESMFADLVSLIARVRSTTATTQLALGVGCGGPMTAGGETVSPLNITAWRSFPLRRRLHEATGLPTWVDNDAKALALAEGWVGAAKGVSDYIAMVVSTGVGGGIVSRGRLLDGATGNAGHVGHVYVADGTDDWARHPGGLLESEASGTAIAERTGRPAAQASDDVKAQTGIYVGRAVASVANLLDLKLALVGGSVALGFGEPFFRAAQTEIDRLAVLDFSVGTQIKPVGLGDESPLVGAAAVALRGRGVDIGVA